jgi:hypothetical protein
VLGVLFACDADSLLEVTKSEGEIKAVLQVSRNLKRLLLVALAFEETCDLVVLVLGYGG